MRIRRSLPVLTVCGAALIAATEARAQFGFDCQSVNFEEAVLGTASDDKVKAATHAACAYWIRRGMTKFPQGWDVKSRIGEARDYVKDLNRLGDKAIELNFATADVRGIGNIKNVAIDMGWLKYWLKESEERVGDSSSGRARTRTRQTDSDSGSSRREIPTWKAPQLYMNGQGGLTIVPNGRPMN